MNVIVAALDTEVREQFFFIDCGNERTLPLSVFLKCELNYWAVNKIVHCNVSLFYVHPCRRLPHFCNQKILQHWKCFSIRSSAFLYLAFLCLTYVKNPPAKILFEHVGEGGGGGWGPVNWSPSYWSNLNMSRAGLWPCTEGGGTGVLYRLEARILYRDEQTDTHNWKHYLPATSLAGSKDAFIPHITFWDSFRSLGSRCEIQINECEEIAPCQNEANCSDTDGDYQCNCTLGGYNW